MYIQYQINMIYLKRILENKNTKSILTFLRKNNIIIKKFNNLIK